MSAMRKNADFTTEIKKVEIGQARTMEAFESNATTSGDMIGEIDISEIAVADERKKMEVFITKGKGTERVESLLETVERTAVHWGPFNDGSGFA
jgi:hypothetical protein